MDEAGLSGIDFYTAGKYRSTAPLPMVEVVILFHFHCHRGCQQCTSLSHSVLLRPWARYSRFPAQGSITNV